MAIALAVLAVDFVLYAVGPWWLIGLWLVVGLTPKAGLCSFNHHHQHIPTFRQAPLNRVLDLVYGLITGVAGHAWVLHHSLGHHLNYLDQAKDESRWARKDGSKMGEWEYSFLTALTAYPRAWATGAKYPKQRAVFAVMTVLTFGTVATLVALKPAQGLVLFVLNPGLMLLLTAQATYSHHSGRSTATHFVASNNIIQPFYNWLTGNLGYHTAHHYKPGVHWSKLPQLHAEIADKIPDDAYHEPGYPWRWLGKSELHPTPPLTAPLPEGSRPAS